MSRFVYVISVILLSASAASAQTDIYIRGSGRLFPIALPQLCLQEGTTTASKDIPEVIARDLDLSGYFQVLDPNAYIEAPGKCVSADQVAYSDWSVIGAEGLVRGVIIEADDKLKVQLYLHDVQRQKVVLGKEYEGDVTYIRKIAHRFANEIMRFFTGEYGIFGSQIAYVSKVGRFKEIFVMDMDGSNVRQLSNDRGLALSPAWDPQGRSVIYTSHRQRVPDIFTVDIAQRQVRQLTRGPALELGAKYSKDGRLVALSRTIGSESDIVLLNADGRLNKVATRGDAAIDVSPDWSPDNSQLVFCSNRGGGPQIYTMNADGSNIKRISFVASTYCTSPVWSPKGDKIAFVCLAEGSNQIFVVNPDGSQPLQLTSTGSNEDPSWSPDGNYIVFATTFGRGRTFNLALMRPDGSNLRQLTKNSSGDTDPFWGPVGD